MFFARIQSHMKARNKRHRKWWLWLGLGMLVFVLYCNIRIDSYSKSRVHDDMSVISHYHTALVLGTSPIGRNDGPNRFFAARINATAELYKAGKVDRIIVSGDNRKKEYNEPEEMKQALVKEGIPADVIFLDYAGFRTFDSVVRAKEVFGQASLSARNSIMKGPFSLQGKKESRTSVIMLPMLDSTMASSHMSGSGSQDVRCFWTLSLERSLISWANLLISDEKNPIYRLQLRRNQDHPR